MHNLIQKIGELIAYLQMHAKVDREAGRIPAAEEIDEYVYAISEYMRIMQDGAKATETDANVTSDTCARHTH